jgi:hypothetical protein
MPFANALAALTLLLLAVHAVSLDPAGSAVTSFPAACTKLQGCSRVALSRPHNAGDEAPLRLRTTMEGARRAVLEWVGGRARSDVLFGGATAGADGSRVVHARVVTLVWGFAGEFGVL